jgi:Tfp pilus assembly protein PilV
MSPAPRHQRGLSLLSVIVAGFVIGFVSLLGFKLLPSYLEQYTINRTLRTMAANKELARASVPEIRNAFNRQTQIDAIHSITASDLQISRNGDQLVLSANYQATIPLFWNISLLIDFSVSSQ